MTPQQASDEAERLKAILQEHPEDLNASACYHNTVRQAGRVKGALYRITNDPRGFDRAGIRYHSPLKKGKPD